MQTVKRTPYSAVLQAVLADAVPAMLYLNCRFSTGRSMEKSITWLVAAFLWLASLAALAQGGVELQQNAPDRYTVQKGDTLWGISSRLLKDPWRWPELWRLNDEQIRNPNRIYPGDVIVLDRNANPPRASLESQAQQQEPTVKLSPRVYAEPIAAAAIPPIPAQAIEPYLTQPLVIEPGGLDHAPRIVATEEDRVYLGPGGTVYASGIGDSKQVDWQVFRPGHPLVDPDTGLTLGIEAVYLGVGRVVKQGEPATISIVRASHEITSGDRLVAVNPPEMTPYLPHAPSAQIRARVISIYDRLASAQGGRYAIVALNKGRRDGLENGHVLALQRSVVAYPTSSDPLSPPRARGEPVQLPDERYGLLFVFRTFDAVSYAMVMDSSRPVTAGDAAQTP